MSKINLAEKKKILDFKEDVFAKLNQLREERESMEKNEIFKKIIAEKFLKEDGEDYDDGSEVIDEEDFEYEDEDENEDLDIGLSDEEEEEILKEFENELGA